MTLPTNGTQQLPGTEWYDAFVAELAARGATAGQVSDQVATVHSHCMDAQQNPQLLFGPARDYARELTPRPTAFGPLRLAHALAMWSFIAICLTAPGAVRWAVDGRDSTAWFSMAMVALVPLEFGLAALLARLTSWRVAAWLSMAVGIPALVTAWIWIPLDALAPGWLSGAVTATGLATGLLAARWGRRQRIADPLTGSPYAVQGNQPTWLWLSLSAVAICAIVLITGVTN